LLLAWEEELTWREEALSAREEKARILEKVLTMVSPDLNTEWAKADTTGKEYRDKIEAHTAHAKHSLSLDKMLGDKKVLLDGRERNLSLHEVARVEKQTLGLNPRDNREELMEFVKLWRIHQDTEVDRVTEAGWLAILRGVCPRFWRILACLPSWGSHEIRSQPTTSWRQWM
jgi:hypothetical protein